MLEKNTVSIFSFSALPITMTLAALQYYRIIRSSAMPEKVQFYIFSFSAPPITMCVSPLRNK